VENLVIGAPNFVAMHLVAGLRQRGEPVRALIPPVPPDDALGERARRRLDELGAEVRVVPLSDSPGLVSAAEGAERLYYADWRFQDWGAEPFAEDSDARNRRNILAAATRARVPRLIYLSTTDVYGFPGEPVREVDQPSPPGLPWADGRAEAEIAVWEHARRVHLPITVLRPATVYGPGAHEFVLNLVALLRRRRLVLVDEGRHVAGLTYVTNLVDAMVLAAHSPAAEGKAYNVTDDSSVTWATYIQALATLVELPPPTRSYSRARAMAMASVWERTATLFGGNERPPLTRLMVELMGTDQRYPIDRARRELGYQPQVSLERGIRETGDWLRRHEGMRT
jgi:nucleoside-diphosphate-sugar epimerase